MKINKDLLFPYIIFNKEFVYNEFITVYPIKMKDIVAFQQYQNALTLRKDSIFNDKKIIKMGYLEFIKYACMNEELSEKYEIPLLQFYYYFVIEMLRLACGEGTEITYNKENLDFYINGFNITEEVFDDLRRIIIIQNDIDFNIDEFMNIETIKALEKAREFEEKKRKEKSGIEDYIDSLIVSMKFTEEYVANMTIRKFWRYIRRINMHEEYMACHTGEMGGMVTFKEPLKHWMSGNDEEDKYKNLKADEDELRSKIE